MNPGGYCSLLDGKLPVTSRRAKRARRVSQRHLQRGTQIGSTFGSMQFGDMCSGLHAEPPRAKSVRRDCSELAEGVGITQRLLTYGAFRVGGPPIP